MPTLVALFLLILPWINPFTFGPTPAVVPWLFSIFCFGAVLGLGATATYRSAHGASTEAWIRVIAGAWLAAAVISAVIGLVQYFGISGFLAPWISGTVLGEAFGNLRQRNQFATLMAIGLAATAWWLNRGLSIRWANAGVMVLALGSAASSSRTGLLQWVLFTLVAAHWGVARQAALRRVMLLAFLAYLIGMVGLPLLAGLDPLNSGAWARLRVADEACTGRVTLWSNVLHLIAQKPWSGWGWGELDYAHFMTLYPYQTRFCDILDNAHNLPLHLGVELGIPVLVAACAPLVWLVVRVRPWRETHPTRQLAWSVLALIGLHSLLEYPLWYGPFQMAAGLSVWMLWETSPGPTITAPGVGRFMPVAPVLVGMFASLLIAICAFTAWDYWRIGQLYLAPQDRALGYRHDTMEKVKGSSLFQDQVEFAELTTEVLSPANAEHLHAMALRLLHFSPEPRIVEKLIESAVLLGRRDEALFYLQRYKAAFPREHVAWAARLTGDKAP